MSFDTQILQVLHNYRQQHPGDPKISLKELIDEIPEAKRADVIEDLHGLQEKGWVGYDLTDKAESGLVWLTRQGIKVAKKIPQTLSSDNQKNHLKQTAAVPSLTDYPLPYEVLWKQDQLIPKPEHIFAGSDYLCVVGNSGKILYFLSLSDGETLLQVTIEELFSKDYVITDGASVPSGELFLALFPLNYSETACFVKLKFDSEHSKQPEIIPIYSAKEWQFLGPVISDEKIYLIEPRIGGPTLVTLDYNGSNALEQALASSKPYRDFTSFVLIDNLLCLALFEGPILAINSKTGNVERELYQNPNKENFSLLAADGRNLFFVTYGDHHSPQIHTIDVPFERRSDFYLPPESSTIQCKVKGRPLVLNDIICISGYDHFLYAFDRKTGEKLWSYEMAHHIKHGPIWVGEEIVVMDRGGGGEHGTVQALRFGKPKFIVTCHYDVNKQPRLNEQNPLIFTLINVGHRTAYNTVLQISSECDFVGESPHHTQQIGTVLPCHFMRSTKTLKPTASGIAVHLRAEVSYKYGNNEGVDHVNLHIPVLRPDETQDESLQYNFAALKALLIATFTDSNDLTEMCKASFSPVYEKIEREVNRTERINKLIEYVKQHHQRVEDLLIEIKKRNSIRYTQYIEDIVLYNQQSEVSSLLNQKQEYVLSTKLKYTLSSILRKCDEFASDENLRAIMDVKPLHIYKDDIPSAHTRKKRVTYFLANFQSKRLADGRLVLPLFLQELRRQYAQEDAIYTELTEVLAYLPGGGEPLPKSPSSNFPEANPVQFTRAYIAELQLLLDRSQAVGKLVVTQYIDGEAKRRETGTAWLIAPGLAMTCWHVLEARSHKEDLPSETDLEEQIANIRFNLGFTRPAEGQGYAVKLVYANRDKDTLDYAILRLENWNVHHDYYLPINTSAPLGTSTDLYIVHHPQGQPQQFTHGRSLGFRSDTPERFSHQLDTDPGSSGSPIFDAQNLAVVAMHRGKTYDGTPEGIILCSILEDLKQHGPTDLYEKINLAQQEKGGR